MAQAILGLSAFYHDSAAALIIDGKIVAAAQEERFSRKKHDASFPGHATAYVLAEAGLKTDDLTAVAFYDKPFLKFERLLETYHAFAPRGLASFTSAIPVWIKEKLFMKSMLRHELARLGDSKAPLLFPEHHLSHAASAFYPSQFDEAAILTIDGVGEWATTTLGHGQDNRITVLNELHFPHSLGLLYSAFTYYVGFKVNSGEYKLMGLAPYGNPGASQTLDFKKKILTNLVDLRDDGSILLNMDYFNYATGLQMCRDKKWCELFGIARRAPNSEITQEYANMALAIQRVTEEIVLRIARTAHEMTKSSRLVLAGGVALNSVANGKLTGSTPFQEIWIQPAAGDAGGALGAALAAWHIWLGNKRDRFDDRDGMQGAYLGPAFGWQQANNLTYKYDAVYEHYQDFAVLATQVAELLARGKVVGWFQGRMEFGPRALGNRSILGDARDPEMQKKMNLKIKHREGFRPFAPAVLEEDISAYFELDHPSPYMLLVASVAPERRNPLPENFAELSLYDKLYYQRSDLPAITHVDYSARLQSVNKETNPRFWQLLNAFKQKTGYGVLINTSFNVRGEPIVCTPDDAYRCFMRTEMDYLVIEDCLFAKAQQPERLRETLATESFEED